MAQMIPLFNARIRDLKATLKAWNSASLEEQESFQDDAREYLSTLMGNPSEETAIISRDREVAPDPDDDIPYIDVYIDWPE
jgi:hypothetical protein